MNVRNERQAYDDLAATSRDSGGCWQHDDERRNLNEARGIIYGVLFGSAFWVIVFTAWALSS